MSATVLVIEDDPASLELMSYLLRAHGYNTLKALRGDEGLALARAHRPDLTVCDIQLPAIDGYEIARTLKADPETASLRLVAVTALAMVGDRDRVLACGFDGYVSKPIEPSTFVQQLQPWGLQGGATWKDASETRTTPQERIKTTANSIVILVVDDSPVNIELKRSILEPQGYTVITAQTAADGLAQARTHHPALIFTDIGLPGPSGFELLKWLRTDPQLGSTPVIVITSTHDAASSRRLAQDLGATRFLMRPVEPPVLLAEVAMCLRGRTESERGNGSRR